MKITTSIILILILTTCLMGDYARNLELAQRYIALDKYEDARVILEKLAEEKPDDARTQNMLKQVYRATKDNEALLTIIEKELDQNPNDPEIWADAGQLYLSQGESKKAIDAYDKALELEPQNYGLVMKIFLAYRAWGYYDEAIDVLTTARKGSDDPALFAMEIASLHEIAGNWESAADEYGRYLNKYPDRFREVEDRMNEVSADTTQLAALEEAVEKLREMGVQGDRIDRLQSRLQIRQNKYMDAAESLIEAEKKRGQKGMYMLAFMREALSAGHHDVVNFAGDYLKGAEPRIAEEANMILAKSKRAEGKSDEAVVILEGLKKSNNSSIAASAYTELGKIYLHDINDLDKAGEHFATAVNKYSRIQGAEDSFRGLTDVHLRRGDMESAEEVLNHKRSISPNDPWALFGVGEMAFFRGSTDTAAAAFRAVALSFPKSTEANNAVRYLALIVDAAQSEAMPRIAQAFKFLRQKRLGEAKSLLDELITELEKEPWADNLVWTRAMIFTEIGDFDSAKKDYGRIAENYTASFYAPLSLEILGDYAMEDGDLARAVQLYNQILVDYSEAVNIERVREKIRGMPSNI